MLAALQRYANRMDLVSPRPHDAVLEDLAVRHDVLAVVLLDAGDEDVDLLDDPDVLADADLVADAVGLIQEEVHPGRGRSEQVLEGEAAEDDDREGVGAEQDDERPGDDPDLAQRDQDGDVDDAVLGELGQDGDLGELDPLQALGDGECDLVTDHDPGDEDDDRDEELGEQRGHLGGEPLEVVDPGDGDGREERDADDEPRREGGDDRDGRRSEAAHRPLEGRPLDGLGHADAPKQSAVHPAGRHPEDDPDDHEPRCDEQVVRNRREDLLDRDHPSTPPGRAPGPAPSP